MHLTLIVILVFQIGTPSTLHCYDVDKNKDLFFKDITGKWGEACSAQMNVHTACIITFATAWMRMSACADGVNVIVVGKYGGSESTLALVGGNCSIQASKLGT